ncbi:MULTISPECIES: phosphoribosyltransferase family protein [Amycolatopsis]|uniref:Phosphoribosyltransferase family protein n=2 Tax=Amycolatopsis TaxID=1813 RepID=A0ABP9QMT8_9PSEU|nr:phosphoribosyltransferase family protein [Amycolatopsis sacchari]SFI60672.1 putative phosphoribosyl transferase [Amycolatopsis sacchari]
MVVDDRTTAGGQLAGRLRDLRADRPVVLGLPRGGVVVADPIATALAAPLDVVLVSKVADPADPEFALGAVGEGAVVVGGCIAPGLLGSALQAVAERARRYRAVRRAVPVAGRTVVLADDGIATGATVLAALRVLTARRAGRVVVAVPVAARAALKALSPFADRVECLLAPPRLGAVSRWYADFREVTDDEVLWLLAAHAEVPA